MDFDFTIKISEKQQSGCFSFHQIYRDSKNRQKKRLTIYDMNTTLVKPIDVVNNQYNGILQLTRSDANQIREMERLLEISIREQLDNSEYTLKSEVLNKYQLPFRLPVIKGQIITSIRNKLKYVSYSEIPLNNNLVVTLRLDNIWSRDDYYGAFLYKWKAIKIQVMS